MDDVAAVSPNCQELQAVKERVMQALEKEVDQILQLVTDKTSASELLGTVEFELRDRVHQLGAQVLQAGLDQVKKKPIAVPRTSANIVARN
jgi:hypothetical protein